MDNRFLSRGKRVDNGEWVQGYVIGPKRNHLNCLDDDGEGYLVPVDPSTVGQCTGLEDKNGKLIFEGDVLIDKTPLDGPYIYEVFWNDSEYSFRNSQGFVNGLFPINHSRCEIIATTHDTPGELGGEKGGEDVEE